MGLESDSQHPGLTAAVYDNPSMNQMGSYERRDDVVNEGK